MQAVRRASQRFALVILGLGIALVVTELGLQLASWVVRSGSSRASAEVVDEQTITLLCVGDSHTYGPPGDVAQSYPAHLERLLRERFPARDFEVLNYGIPGTNSSIVSDRMEINLIRTRPDLVIVWVGVNNVWNRTGTDSPHGLLGRLASASRLYRLVSIARSSRAVPDYQLVQGRIPGGQFGEDLWVRENLPPGSGGEYLTKLLEVDFARIVSIANARDIPTLFVGYPGHSYWLRERGVEAGLNGLIRTSSQRAGSFAIDTRQILLAEMDQGVTRKQLIDTKLGQHPTGLLYGKIAESMLPIVIEHLNGGRSLNLRQGKP
jgi:hypothetical protein